MTSKPWASFFVPRHALDDQADVAVRNRRRASGTQMMSTHQPIMAGTR